MIMHKLKLPTDQASEASIVMVRKMPQGYKRSNRFQSIEPWQERQEQRKDEAVDTFVRPFLKDNLPPQTSVGAAMDDNRSDTATDGEREGKCLPFGGVPAVGNARDTPSRCSQRAPESMLDANDMAHS